MTVGNRVFWSIMVFIGVNLLWVAFLGSPLNFFGSGFILSLICTALTFLLIPKAK